MDPRVGPCRWAEARQDDRDQNERNEHVSDHVSPPLSWPVSLTARTWSLDIIPLRGTLTKAKTGPLDQPGWASVGCPHRSDSSLTLTGDEQQTAFVQASSSLSDA